MVNPELENLLREFEVQMNAAEDRVSKARGEEDPPTAEENQAMQEVVAETEQVFNFMVEHATEHLRYTQAACFRGCNGDLVGSFLESLGADDLMRLVSVAVRQAAERQYDKGSDVSA